VNEGSQRCLQNVRCSKVQTRWNARGSSLTRDGVNYILQQVAERAVARCPSALNTFLRTFFVTIYPS
jgi:hypothetical protein